MRALTVRQPWADLIVAGAKDVENRTWPVPSTLPCMRAGGPHEHRGDAGLACTPFPFTLAVHAAKKPDPNIREVLTELYGSKAYLSARALPGDLPSRRGAILATVEVTGCHPFTNCLTGDVDSSFALCSMWAQDIRDGDKPLYHWTFANPRPLPTPIPAKGSRGLWRLTNEQMEGLA